MPRIQLRYVALAAPVIALSIVWAMQRGDDTVPADTPLAVNGVDLPSSAGSRAAHDVDGTAFGPSASNPELVIISELDDITKSTTQQRFTAAPYTPIARATVFNSEPLTIALVSDNRGALRPSPNQLVMNGRSSRSIDSFRNRTRGTHIGDGNEPRSGGGFSISIGGGGICVPPGGSAAGLIADRAPRIAIGY